MKGPDLARELPGTWRLRSFEVRLDDGELLRPWGEQPRGRLTYLPTGLMTVVMTAGAGRRLSVPLHLAASEAELAPLARTCIAYSGRWVPLVDRVEHHPDVSLNPNYLAGPEVRLVTLVGDALTLSALPTPFGERSAVRRIIWTRETAGGA